MNGSVCAGTAVLLSLAVGVLLAGCTSTRVEEQRLDRVTTRKGDAAVVLGRRHRSDQETEPDFVSCVGGKLESAGLGVITESDFMNRFYPWFEPRTAPMNLERLQDLMHKPGVSDRMREMQLRYIVWVDGQTRTVDKKGSVSCAAGPGGAGCLGFGMWEKHSTYEAKVWDLQRMQSVAEVSAEAEGTTYMPALIVPVPIVARVQSAACNGLGTQLEKLFEGG